MDMESSDREVAARFEVAAQAAGVLCALLGAAVLLGWALGIEVLKAPTHQGAMKPITAASVLLLGTALALARPGAPRAQRAARVLLSLLVTAIAGLTLGEYLTKAGSLEPTRWRDPGAVYLSPGRMSWVSALTLLLIGPALLAIDARTRVGQRLSEWTATGAFLIALLGLTDYALDWQNTITGMASHSVLALLLLSAGILAARPDRGLMKTVSERHSGGVAARRLLPMALAVPLVLGGLRSSAQRAGIVDVEWGIAVMTLGNIALLVAALWFTATRLNQADESTLRARAAAEQELSRQQFYTRSLIEASVDPLVTIGADGKITDVNHATESATGLLREALVGTDFCEYFTEPERARAGYQQAFAEGPVRDYALAIRHSSGRLMDVLYNASVFKNAGGAVQGVFAAARDVTERRRAEHAVEAERQRMRDVLDCLPAYVVLLAPDYHVPFANRLFRERFGESHGRRCFEYLFERSEPCEVCETFKVLQDGQSHQWKWTGPDGRRYDVSDFPFADTDGTRLILEMGLDVTEREQTEAALAQRTAELERSNQELQDFASIASHDLQEPLRKILAFGDRLRSHSGDGLDPQGADYLGRMQNAASRMSGLIEALLHYSRVTTQAQPFERVGLEAVVAEVLADLESRMQESGAQVSVGRLPEVRADRVQMRQLMQNLLSNAMKFHRPGAPPHIRIESQAEPDEGWQITVTDDGIGFDEAYVERIFRPFQRLHGRDEYEGSGMGLAICRKIVEGHAGKIYARSRPGQGAVFAFTLPGVVQEEHADASFAAAGHSDGRR